MPVLYDSKSLIPAPFIAVSKETISRDDGAVLGSVYVITVRGKLVAWKGSPNSQGGFWTQSGYPADEVIPAESRLSAILRKQEALRALFAVDGRPFEVSGYDGFAPLVCNPRVKKVEFTDGEGKGANWTEYCEYAVTLEADALHGLTTDNAADLRVSKVSEDWNVELLDEKVGTYRLTRSVSATGRRLFDEAGALLDGKQAWENARSYVLDTVGLGLKPAMMVADGVLNGTGLQAFNYVRTENVGEMSGLFSVTESWVCYDPGAGAPATHEQTITVRTSAADGKTTVNVEGTIQGLEKRHDTTRAFISSRADNANAKWAQVSGTLHGAASSVAGGVTLASVPAQSSVGTNSAAGTITYSYEFDDRLTPTTPGALSESLTITNSHPQDVFASIPVLGRPLGPVLQGMGTVTSRKRSISMDIQMRPGAAAPNTGGVVLSLMPGGQVFVEQDEESYTPNTGRYTRQTTFVYQ